MVDMLHRLIGEEIEMVAELAPEIGRVRADRGQLEQAILNLVVNARDAMPAGGRLEIETADLEVSEGAGPEGQEIPAGRWVRVSVRDSGVGMDAETLAHIFEPFFTTKLRGKGTGLGLATVYGIVEQSSGQIRVRSKPGAGTAFDIYLPRIEAPIEKTPAALPGRGAREGTETVLLVEDEESVRTMVERVLRERGYQVLTAGDGESALRVSRERDGAVHLLLTDLVMPGLSGSETADRLRHERSDMRVLFMSGHADERAVPSALLASGAAFIQKPFTPFALAAKVREVLDARA
jgi:CheY-like chemotaxis protein